jgi:hypothetical protein
MEPQNKSNFTDKGSPLNERKGDSGSADDSCLRGRHLEYKLYRSPLNPRELKASSMAITSSVRE